MNSTTWWCVVWWYCHRRLHSCRRRWSYNDEWHMGCGRLLMIYDWAGIFRIRYTCVTDVNGEWYSFLFYWQLQRYTIRHSRGNIWINMMFVCHRIAIWLETSPFNDHFPLIILNNEGRNHVYSYAVHDTDCSKHERNHRR